MKQQINLVNLALLPPKPDFQFKSMVLSLLVIVAAMLLLTLLFVSRIGAYESAAEQSKQRVTLKETQVKALEQQVAARQKDPKVAAELLGKQDEQRRLQKMANALQQGGLLGQPAPSYAAYLYALASKPTQGVWLTQIEFHGPRMLLQGMAMQADDIPAYLTQLKGMSAFAGQRFVSFELGRKVSAEGVAQSGPTPPQALEFKLQPVVESKE
ncbi:PilN domain-containing protein [Uliginosibacterium gangwonense]|uniref:PilN domain-containing protein n=1 Tax=Uliginosibacterium gangwonense TaxID=392736 RepID=UPI000365A2FE|nr:PilN domain-containing protein [Uliginosibacterium gangwonense]